MTTRRFFSEVPGSGNTIRITGDEFYHLKTVNRSRPGDGVEVVNGNGTLYHGTIRSISGSEAVVGVTSREFREKPAARVIIAPSLLKQRPMNILIEKLAEIGVDEIRPVMFDRTDDKYGPARLKKWQRIAVQALKVNRRLWATEIYPPVSLPDIIGTAGPLATRVLLDISGGKPGAAAWEQPAIAVIGPPGDITDAERQTLVDGGFVPYSINECVMKSETAAISIAAILKLNSQPPAAG